MIFPAIRSAILRVTGVTVSEVFASTDQVAVEMADLVNEVAIDIVKSHDWRALTKIATVTGGESHPLPDDFDRMLANARVEDTSSWFWGYQGFESVNEWMRYKSGSFGAPSPGGWIMLGGELQFYPAPSGTAQYPYISNEYARAEDGTPKGEFDADNDTFLLDNRLLTLGLIWQWQAQKGMDYSEAMASYELALARAQSRDKGARLLRSPLGGWRPDARLAYSGRAIG